MESVSKAFRKLAKTCHDMCAPDQSCVQYWLLPERAPEWYRKIVLGTGSSDVHVRSAPRDALPLLGAGNASFCELWPGHIELSVPKLEDAKLFWMEGLGCGETYQESKRELMAHLGPSQVRFSEGQATHWPGERPGFVGAEPMPEDPDLGGGHSSRGGGSGFRTTKVQPCGKALRRA